MDRVFIRLITDNRVLEIDWEELCSGKTTWFLHSLHKGRMFILKLQSRNNPYFLELDIVDMTLQWGDTRNTVVHKEVIILDFYRAISKISLYNKSGGLSVFTGGVSEECAYKETLEFKLSDYIQ